MILDTRKMKYGRICSCDKQKKMTQIKTKETLVKN